MVESLLKLFILQYNADFYKLHDQEPRSQENNQQNHNNVLVAHGFMLVLIRNYPRMFLALETAIFRGY